MMTNPLEMISRGNVSQHIRNSLTDKLFDLEYTIITNLVYSYRRGDLTDNTLRGGIGEIAGLRELARSLETDIRRGNAEAEKEYAHGEEENND